MNNNNYDTSKITSLSNLQALRTRPAMYIGSTSSQGINQIIQEVIDNCLDEYSAGYGNEVNIYIDKDNFIEIADKGRGIPVGNHSEWKKDDGTPLNTLTGVLTKLHSGGKFRRDGSSGYFNGSTGTYGIGVKTTNAMSQIFICTVKRDGKIYQQSFSKGEPTTEVLEIGKTSETGTTIKFRPDKEIFKETIAPNDKKLQSRLHEITALNANLKINYKNELTGVDKQFFYENGISDYILQELLVDKKLLFDTPLYYSSSYSNEDETIQVEFSLLYQDSLEDNQIIKTFANNVTTREHGTHLQGFKEGYKEAINNYALKQKLINQPLEIKYLFDNLCLIISVHLRECELEGQTKNKLGNTIAKDGVYEVVKEFFGKLSKEQKTIIDTIIIRANAVKEAEEAARKAKINSRKASKVTKMALPGKLADCATNKGYSEVFFTEGDSASGSAISARTSSYQAIMPLRGKILNTEKVDFDKALSSDTAKSLIACIGTGVGKQFNLDRCRYNKLIIMADADIDGSHICNLILTLIYNYMRPLLEQGYVYTTCPPLYKITNKKERIYLKDDAELKQYRKEHKGENYTVNRFKG